MSRPYVLGHSQAELERLTAQARLLEPFTRRLFEDAGIGPGMRVLDAGCGHGDVTLLAAEQVGPTGEVVGLDNAPAAVEASRRRCASIPNVDVVLGDLAEVTFERPFDAVVGRTVLGYVADPVAALRNLRACVAPGGVVAFQEWDLDGVPHQTHAPLFARSARLVVDALRAGGFRTDLGLDLAALFQEAGLPAPWLGADIAIGEDLFELAAGLIRSLLGAIERFGLATAGELEVETLAARLRDEASRSRRPVIGMPFVRACARTPLS
jgi:SAM-dependent methyltransferase